MGLHYVYVNSQDKKNDENINDFTINLHHPTSNVIRVGVQSFLTSNASHNITKNNNRVRWLEQEIADIDTIGNTNRTRKMVIEIDIGYNNINELFSRADLNKILFFMKKDKKNDTKKINLVLLKKIGYPVYKLQFDEKKILSFLRKELIN